MEQQKETSTLGMWLFLVTEIMFFGGLFTAYVIYRNMYPDAFAAASSTLNMPLGAFNTAVLICSSLTMALAIRSAQVNQRGRIAFFLLLTMVLGTTFLVVKGFEYHDKFVESHIPGDKFKPFNFVLENEHEASVAHAADPLYQRHAEIFFSLYFIMTGIHATHMIIGIAILPAREVRLRVLQPAGDDRPLLALRRHRLDLPLPPALPAGRAYQVTPPGDRIAENDPWLRTTSPPSGPTSTSSSPCWSAPA
jgi:heme/copper-type cytochrome/quinol oxidase subunit 3